MSGEISVQGDHEPEPLQTRQFVLGQTRQQRKRIALLLVATLLSLWLLWRARGALFPYIVALVLAYLMLPAVNLFDRWLQRAIRHPRLTRPLAIVVVYLISAGVVALFVSAVVPVVSAQFRLLWDNRLELIAEIQKPASRLVLWYQKEVPPEIQVQVDDLVRRAGGTIASALQIGATRTVNVLTSTVGFIIAMIVVPFWLFYVLNDEARFARGVMDGLPRRWRADVVNILRIVDGILGSYVRGQLLLCLAIGMMATAGLTLLGVEFAAVLGLMAGVCEILPFIGPTLGLIPALLVATIQAPLLGLWTLLLFIGLQQVENLLLAPRVSGHAVHLHPAVIMVVLVMGNELGGLWGMLLAVPITAICRDLFRYLYMRFQEEPLSPGEALARLRRKPV